MPTDAQLVAQAQSGDPQAFAQLAHRHAPRLFRLALSILGREFAPEAEDVAQETLLKAHSALPTFRGDAQFGTWLYRIAFNRALNLKARVRFRAPHAPSETLARTPTTHPSPHHQAEQAQRDQALLEAIAALPEVYQSALRLHYWLEAPISEIAALLDVPENTAKSYLHRARQLLEATLTRKGITPND